MMMRTAHAVQQRHGLDTYISGDTNYINIELTSIFSRYE